MEVLNTIANKAQSDWVLALLIMAIVMVLVVKPLFKQILMVIQGNSTVMAELKTLLTNTNTNCKECKTEQIGYFRRFEDKLDKIVEKETVHVDKHRVS